MPEIDQTFRDIEAFEMKTEWLTVSTVLSMSFYTGLLLTYRSYISLASWARYSRGSALLRMKRFLLMKNITFAADLGSCRKSGGSRWELGKTRIVFKPLSKAQTTQPTSRTERTKLSQMVGPTLSLWMTRHLLCHRPKKMRLWQLTNRKAMPQRMRLLRSLKRTLNQFPQIIGAKK